MATTKNALLVQFDNARFGNIRGLLIDGEPWFVGKDVATALGYENPRAALKQHVPGKYKRVSQITTPGGAQRMTIINEAGLYKLIFKSNLPQAEDFSDWVCEDVMPSIRKHGFYAVDTEAEKTRQLWDFSKIGRREVTDVVQKFNKRDYIDGDKNPQARGRYARLTNNTQVKVVGIPAGGRSVAEPEKLARLIFSEKAVANALNRAYEKGESFSQAERRAVDTAKHCQLLFNGSLQELLEKAVAS